MANSHGRLALLALSRLLLGLGPIVLSSISTVFERVKSEHSYLLLLRLILVILAGIIVLLILVVLVIEVAEIVLIDLLESEGLTREPINGPGDQLLLDILPELVVELQAILNIRGSVVIIV